MKTAKAQKPQSQLQQAGSAQSPKPVKSWSKVAAAGQSKSAAQHDQPAKQVSEYSQETPQANHDRLTSLLSKMINSEAEVGTKDGLRYRGIVKSVDSQGPIALVLSSAAQIHATNGQSNGLKHKTSELSIKSDDLVDVFAAKLDLSRAAPAVTKSQTPASGVWKTDNDISGRLQVKERVLQAWQAPQDDAGFSIEDDLGSATNNSAPAKKWDQFAANEKLFGVKSQWDEDVYTYKLDTSRPDFAQRQAVAERLAREIEQSSSTNTHVLEERGVDIDDSGLTEEDKYSGVQRNPNAWVPPARRPVANLPTPRATPVDPGIISSQLSKASPSAHKPATSVGPIPKQVLKDGAKFNDPTPSSSTRATKPIEADLMTKFKQFATNERDRLSVKKASTFKKEQDGRLKDLLAFSKDFKLNTPVPEDLIPILAKDKTKQDAILQKAASSVTPSPTTLKPSASSVKTPDSTLKSRIDRAHQHAGPLSTPSPLSKEEITEIRKLKPSAAEFRPFNPTASSFTPSGTVRAQLADSLTLSTPSSQPRPVFNADVASFFPRKLRPMSERSPILDQFNPFKTFAEKNPDSTIEIETPLKVDPAWPSENSTSITDPPQDSRRPPHLDDQFAVGSPQFVPSPNAQLMFVGTLPQNPGYQQQAYYSGKGQPYMPVPPGQFASYQGGPGFVPPQYMYQGVQGYNRAMQPQLMPVPYPNQPFNNFTQPMSGSPQLVLNYGSTGSPRVRQAQTIPHNPRSPEIRKTSPRPPPMSTEPPKNA